MSIPPRPFSKLLPGAERVADRGEDRVGALAEQLADDIRLVVDDVDIVALATFQNVCAGAAVQCIIPAEAADEIGIARADQIIAAGGALNVHAVVS